MSEPPDGTGRPADAVSPHSGRSVRDLLNTAADLIREHSDDAQAIVIGHMRASARSGSDDGIRYWQDVSRGIFDLTRPAIAAGVV